MTDAAIVQDVLQRYFTAEKREAALFLALGLAGIACSTWLFLRPTHGMRAALWPIGAVALIQIVVGSSVYFRTDRQIVTLSTQLHTAPDRFQRDETKRMERVMLAFRFYKALEVVLLLIGVALLALRRPPSVAFAVGAGLVLQASIMLALDLVAERRGEDYLDTVRAIAES